MENDAADQLDIEMAHAEGPLGSLPHDGKGLGQEIVKRLFAFKALSELVGLGPQVLVRQAGDAAFQGVYIVNQHLDALELALVRGAENLLQDRSDHSLLFSNNRIRDG